METANNIKQQQNSKLRYFDIAANLASGVYAGNYRGQQMHTPDLDEVLKRANDVGCDRLLISSTCYKDAKTCLDIAKRSDKFYCTVGVHPTRVNDIDRFGGKERYFKNMEDLIVRCGEKCVAIGECGLDYDRLMCSTKETQLKYFPVHFDLAEKFHKPMYFHDRNTSGDFLKLVKENRHKFSTGIVHTFTGTEEDLKQYLDLDLYIGVSGCSLKKKHNMEVVKKIPLDRLMLETDCPYCEITPSYDSFSLVKTTFPKTYNDKYKKGCMVKSRNEPCTIVQIAEVVSALTKVDIKDFTEITYENTMKVFNLKE